MPLSVVIAGRLAMRLLLCCNPARRARRLGSNVLIDRGMTWPVLRCFARACANALTCPYTPRAIAGPRRSARPGGVEYDAAEVGGLEAPVLEGQYVIVDGAERTVRAMLHPIIEGLDDIVFEVVATRVRCDHRFALGVGELLIGDPEHVHLDTRGDERHFRLLVLWDAGRRVQRDCIPDDLDRGFRDAVAAEKISGRVGAVNLESKLRVAICLGQADIMKHRADIQQFGIELKAFALAGERAEQIDARRMVEQ